MHGLASFDRLLTRARSGTPTGSAAQTRQLLNPQGDSVAELPFPCSPQAILRAAHRIAADDWLGVLADDSRQRGLNNGWRLALLRADRHGQPRLQRDAGPLWLSAPLTARAGLRPQLLKQQAQTLALQALWQAGWRLAR
ncbi:hypothetical protein [Paucibacter soli]|uniref:hypothetical protein n=1 Tax=Paucibacter soli TaxID=3133433 RepID=UPI0030A4259A